MSGLTEPAGRAYLAAACRSAADVPELAGRGSARAIRTVGVVGGGTMGRDIAYVHLVAGHDVVLREVDQERLDAAVAAVRGHVTRRVARAEVTQPEGEALLGSFSAGDAGRILLFCLPVGAFLTAIATYIPALQAAQIPPAAALRVDV